EFGKSLSGPSPRSTGISYVAPAKICRKRDVPLPGRGYWARKAAGQYAEDSPATAQAGTACPVHRRPPLRAGRPCREQRSGHSADRGGRDPSWATGAPTTTPGRRPPPKKLSTLGWWVALGLAPQLSFWMWYTIVFGALLGIVAAAIARRGTAAG